MNFKKIVIVLLIVFSINIQAQENRIVLHGFTHHFDRTDKLGRKWNEFNYGVGFEQSNYSGEEDEFYMTKGINLIKDSNYEPFPFITIGTEIRPSWFKKYIAFSLVGLMGFKKIPMMATDYQGNYLYEKSRKYHFIAGIVPGIKFHYKNFSINYNISPQLEFKYNNREIYIAGFHYLTFGYKF